MLMIMEQFSKWIEFVALPQNSTELAMAAFLDRMLIRFRASAKVLTDQGGEFTSVFEELYSKAFINHHTISWDHSEADGLVEWVV